MKFLALIFAASTVMFAQAPAAAPVATKAPAAVVAPAPKASRQDIHPIGEKAVAKKAKAPKKATKAPVAAPAVTPAPKAAAPVKKEVKKA